MFETEQREDDRYPGALLMPRARQRSKLDFVTRACPIRLDVLRPSRIPAHPRFPLLFEPVETI